MSGLKMQFRALALGTALSVATLPLHSAMAFAPTGEELEAQAVEAYEGGDFSEAARLFEAAYEASGDPNLLYNIGRVHEEAGKLELAIEYYDRFIHAEGVGLDTRVVASERLSQLRKVVGEEAPEEKPTEPEESSPPEEAKPDPATDDGPSNDADQERRDRGLLIGGTVLLATGGTMAIIGGIMGGLALRTDDRLQTQQLDDPVGTQEQGQRQALTADILIPVGAAFAVSGLALLVVRGVRRRNDDRNVAMSVGATRQSASVGLRGRF